MMRLKTQIGFALLLTATLLLPFYGNLNAQSDWRQFDSVTFVTNYPQARLLDNGKLNLWRYRDYEGSFNELPYAEKPAAVVGALLLELIDSPLDYFLVQEKGQFQQVKTEKGFKEKIKEWFADDPQLLKYIQTNKLKSANLPYLVRMYNGHARRPFDPGSEMPVTFVADGFVDARDGRPYDVIIVNNVTWLAENLRYCHPRWSTCREDSCRRCLPHGFYYTWQSAVEVCPPGWRLPDDTDWRTLFLGFGMPLDKVTRYNKFDKDGMLAKRIRKDSTNAQGFNAIDALPSGTVYFWTDSELSKNSAYSMEISNSTKNRLANTFYPRSARINVRCVK